MQIDDKVLSVGATVSLNVLIATLESHKDLSPKSFPYLADHLKKVASVAVRNVCTLLYCLTCCNIVTTSDWILGW